MAAPKLTGTAANLERGHKVAPVRVPTPSPALSSPSTAPTGSLPVTVHYVLTGTAAELTYEPVGAYVINAADGAYAMTGTAATLRIDRRLVVEAGGYAITGTAADLAVSGVQPPEVPSVGGGGVGYFTRRRWRRLGARKRSA